ncbi:MAG: family 78 glycoside hydrolase catalytic domain [Candidatus Helarchaeota archaeon]
MNASKNSESSLQPSHLTCEYLINPKGIDVLNPRLSWLLKSDTRGQKQTAYQILVASNESLLQDNQGDLWDTGKIESDETTNITYEGKSLKSKMFCFWKVRVWDENNETSAWSSHSFWNMGLINQDDWSARWIGETRKKTSLLKGIIPKFRKKNSQLLRKTFNLEKEVNRALVHVTALGEYELYINGTKVGDHFLSPEWTDYRKRVQYQTHDVTNLLKKGENVIGAMLADGWYAGNLGPGIIPIHGFYGTSRHFLMQLSVEYKDGTNSDIVSDSSWKIWNDGPIQWADHFQGECFNARKEPDGWKEPGFDDHHWSQAIVDESIQVNLVAQMNQPIRIVEEIKPIEVSEPKKGVFIFNLGQNIAGFCKLKIDTSALNSKRVVRLRHGEMLKEDGSLYTKNLRFAKATDKFIINDEKTREYHPRFTYHGFQHVEVTGLKKDFRPDLDMITGCAIASDTPVVGAFECSDPSVNKLWRNIFWTQRDNLISVPTDCPQRNERMGWMGDAMAFCQTSIFNMDMAAFYTKWIKDIRDSQLPNGQYPDFVPFPSRSRHILSVLNFIGAPAWSDCGVLVPWCMYLNYGDERVLQQHYESAKKFIEFVHSRNPNLIWRKSTGNNYGDWLNGNTIKSRDYPKKGGEIPKDVLSTAFFAHSTEVLSKMAKIVGQEDDSKKYAELAQQIKNAFVKEFVDETGKIKGDTQAGYALALHFDLLPEKIRFNAANRLIQALNKYDDRLSTGFCSTLPMMMELSKWGHVEKAYDLLLSRRFPSWFYMIDQGATTMWERWDGFVKGRGFQSWLMNSFCHYAIGSVGEWMYRVILGINPDEEQPSYKHVVIKPQPGGTITWAKGHYDSIRGRISVHWTKNEGKFHLKISIPPNVTASVHIPARNAESITESGTPINAVKDVKLLSHENDVAIIEIQSGRYKFISLM